jgi:hypothetical protein
LLSFSLSCAPLSIQRVLFLLPLRYKQLQDVDENKTIPISPREANVDSFHAKHIVATHASLATSYCIDAASERRLQQQKNMTMVSVF